MACSAGRDGSVRVRRVRDGAIHAIGADPANVRFDEVGELSSAVIGTALPSMSHSVIEAG